MWGGGAKTEMGKTERKRVTRGERRGDGTRMRGAEVDGNVIGIQIGKKVEKVRGTRWGTGGGGRRR